MTTTTVFYIRKNKSRAPVHLNLCVRTARKENQFPRCRVARRLGKKQRRLTTACRSLRQNFASIVRPTTRLQYYQGGTYVIIRTTKMSVLLQLEWDEFQKCWNYNNILRSSLTISTVFSSVFLNILRAYGITRW